jgi:hypothetical protein
MKARYAVCKWAFVSLIIAVNFSPAPANVYTVITTGDTGPGTLRQALTDANAHTGADTIAFNIPTTDAGYNALVGVWTIQPATALPYVTDNGTTIDGSTQTIDQGNKNTVGPEIEISGVAAGSVSGLVIRSATNLIRGLVVNRFNYHGIFLERATSRDNVIIGNYIGTDATGMTRQGNIRNGIYIMDGSRNNQIGNGTVTGRNLIAGSDTSYNIYSGNGIYMQGSDSNRIVGNYIGVNREGTTPLRNVGIGICIREGRFNVVGGTTPGEANIISGNGMTGVSIRSYANGRNLIRGNYIGTDPTGRLNLGNLDYGIRIDFGSTNNTIGPGNFIAYNRLHGIYINHDTTISNTITQNAISNNVGQGIVNANGGNRQLARPIITSVLPASVSGTAVANSIVEIFSDSADEGVRFEGSVTADASGHFAWNGAAAGPRVTATCTNAEGNTSEFSSPMVSVDEEKGDAEVPGEFTLSQNYPNPFNGMSNFEFRLPASLRLYRVEDSQSRQGGQAGISDRVWVTLKVFDMLGREVVTLVNEAKQPGSYSVMFDAGGLASGPYFYRMTAGAFTAVRKMALIR